MCTLCLRPEGVSAARGRRPIFADEIGVMKILGRCSGVRCISSPSVLTGHDVLVQIEIGKHEARRTEAIGFRAKSALKSAPRAEPAILAIHAVEARRSCSYDVETLIRNSRRNRPSWTGRRRKRNAPKPAAALLVLTRRRHVAQRQQMQGRPPTAPFAS